MDKRPDCRTCGVCCVSLQDQDSFCDVTPADVMRLGTRWAKRNVVFPDGWERMERGWPTAIAGVIKTAWRKQRSGPMKGAAACVCVALRGSLRHKVECSVYEKRPRACRVAVKTGDKTCLAVRRMFEEARL